MPTINFTTLTGSKTTAGSIKHWTKLSRIDAEQILDLAQAMIFRGFVNPLTGAPTALRHWRMRARATLTIAADDESVALPTRFLDPAGPIRDTTNGGNIVQVPEDAFEEHCAYTDAGILEAGTPQFFTLTGGLITFNAKWDAAASLRFPHYAEPARLAATSNETNWLTEGYGPLLFSACAAQAAEFMEHAEEAVRQTMKVAGLVYAANAESDLSRMGTIYGTETP